MSKRQRLEAVFAGDEPDRTPILGGWIACPEHLCALANASLREYWQDPTEISIQAYETLGSDGLISVFVPRDETDYRCVDASSYAHAVTDLSIEECLERIDQMPAAEKVEAEFDFAGQYESFRADLVSMQSRCGDMMWVPPQ